MRLGRGGFSWPSVLSLVPGIREDPSVRDLLAGGRERRGGPSWPPGSDLTGVFMVNEGCTEGGCMTIANEGRDDLLVFGYDTSESLINYVYDGILDGMVSQNPYGLGYNAVKQAIAAAEGQTEFNEFIENESVLITPENIHDKDIIAILDPIGTMNLE